MMLLLGTFDNRNYKKKYLNLKARFLIQIKLTQFLPVLIQSLLQDFIIFLQNIIMSIIAALSTITILSTVIKYLLKFQIKLFLIVLVYLLLIFLVSLLLKELLLDQTPLRVVLVANPQTRIQSFICVLFFVALSSPSC